MDTLLWWAATHYLSTIHWQKMEWRNYSKNTSSLPHQVVIQLSLGFGATKESDLEKLVEENGMVFPLFVKVSDSYGSVGIDDSSVCHDLQQLQDKCNALLNQFEQLTIEEYIDGQEFSVLVSGNCRDETWPVIVYPPAGRW